MDYSTVPQPDHTPKASDFPVPVNPDLSGDDQPEWRMGSCRKLLELVVAADRSESRYRFLDVCAEVDDMYDRRPPDDPHALRLDGLGWTCNTDWGGMEFGIDKAIQPEFQLLHTAETFVNIRTKYQGPYHGEQKQKVEEEDREMLKAYTDFLPERGKMLIQRKKYGLGILYFRHPRSWHFQALHPGNLLTDCASINPSRWAWCGIHTEYDITDLLRKLNQNPSEDKAGFADDGWNRNAIRRALALHAQQANGSMDFRWWENAENWRHEYLTHDLYWSHKGQLTIPGYIVYVKEFDGTVTEYSMTKNGDVGFLYRSPKAQRLRHMTDAFCLYPETCGQTLFREVRGFGIKNMAFYDAENSMLNQWLDSTRLAGSMVLQGGTPDDLYNQQDLLMMSAITMVPNHIQIIPNQLPNTGQAFTPIMQFMQNQRMEAAQITGGEGVGSAPDRETKYAAGMRFQQGQRLQTYQVNHLYMLDEQFHRVRFERAFAGGMVSGDLGREEAQEALALMKEAGVSDEFLKSIEFQKTKIRRIMGNGDPAKLYADLQEMAPYVPRMTQDGQQQYFRMLAHAKFDAEMATVFFGKMPDATLMRAKVQAQLENGHFESSDARLDPAGDDNHLVHMDEHTPFVEAKRQAFEQGAITPQQFFETVSRGMAHVGFNEDGQPVGGHIAGIMEDPMTQDAAQDHTRRWADLVNTRRQVGQQLQAQQQAQQEQQLQDLKFPAEEQAKAAKVQQESEIAAQRAMLEIEASRMKLEHQQRMNDLEAQRVELQIEVLKAQRDKAERDAMTPAPSSEKPKRKPPAKKAA